MDWNGKNRHIESESAQMEAGQMENEKERESTLLR